jgi:tetratricopeptide (TPR) repeat protein
MRKWLIFFVAGSVFLTPCQNPAGAAVFLRKIRVEAVVSAGFRSQPNWKSEFQQRLIYASRIFESEFKIQLVLVRYKDWPGVNENDEPRALLEDLLSKFPLSDVDIVIGLTSVKGGAGAIVRDPDTIGQARILSGYLVLRYPMNKLYHIQEQTALTHELGHLFGAVHTKDPNSIMFPVIEKQIPSRFDAENHDIIAGTRSIDFRRGVEALPKISIQRLLGSYLKLAMQDQPFDFYYMVGVLYLNLKQYEDTLKMWKRAEAILPGYPRIHYDLGMIYYQLGDQQNSVRELSRAIQGFRFPSQRPDQINALTALGGVFMAQNNLSAAQNAYSRALVLDPKSKNLKRELAAVQLKMGQVNEAIRTFETLLYQDPENLNLLEDLGIAYYDAKRLGESERYLERALQKAPNGSPENIQAHNYLAKIYYQTKRNDKAIGHFKAACASSTSVDCLRGLGQMYFEAGQWDNCIAELATILKVQKDDADVYGTLAVAFMQKGDYNQALPLLREGLRYAKDNKTAAKFYQNTGHILLQLKNYSLAEQEFQMGISKDWSNMECHTGLATVYIRMQNPAAAKAALEDVLRLDPKNKTARELLDQIEKLMQQTVDTEMHLEPR